MCEPTNQMSVACGVPVCKIEMCFRFFPHPPKKEATKGPKSANLGLSENMVPFTNDQCFSHHFRVKNLHCHCLRATVLAPSST